MMSGMLINYWGELFAIILTNLLGHSATGVCYNFVCYSNTTHHR